MDRHINEDLQAEIYIREVKINPLKCGCSFTEIHAIKAFIVHQYVIMAEA